MRKAFFLIMVLLFINPVMVMAEEKKTQSMIGLGIFTGGECESDPIWHTSPKYDWKQVNLHPMYGWKFNRAEVYFEGSIGYLRFKPSDDDIFSFGLTLMASYDVLRYKHFSLFTELGAGLGYWTDTPSQKLVRHSLLGIFQYGGGVKINITDNIQSRLTARFNHTSALLNGDTGANSYGVLLCVVWLK